MSFTNITSELREAGVHAEELRTALVHLQQNVYAFDELVMQGKFGAVSPAVIIDQAEDIRRTLVQNVENHLVPIGKAIEDSDRIISPLIDYVDLEDARSLIHDQTLSTRESQFAATNLSEVEGALARTARLAPSNPNTISIARIVADEATSGLESARRSIHCLTGYLPRLADRFESGPSPSAPVVQLPEQSIAPVAEKAKVLRLSREINHAEAVGHC